MTAGVSNFTAAPASLGWHERARSLAAAGNMSPLAAARVYAALSVAQYRAVSATDDADTDGLVPESGLGAGGRSALDAHRGAVAGASAEVLSFFFPAAAASLADRVGDEGAAGPGTVHPSFSRGVELGKAAGAAMVARLRQDGFTTPWTGSVPVGPGKWVANGPPAGATFGGVRPYFLETGSQFRPAAPPAFGSAAFTADLNEIHHLSVTRTPEQRAIALQWNYATGTFTPPGYWDLVATNYITSYGLDERAATRVLALTTGAMMDALIACWDAKYFYWTIRPSQADAAITLTFGLPNHPSYPSGHSCVSAAAATTLSELFPDRSAELNAWVNEAGLSRMYAGIHYRFDITAGRDLGIAVAQWALAHPERVAP
ncbi:MAG TPA: vanadium-dependent haloperoxidase [Gemmatimonadales bacterium]|nr:vanadium-dependent haloperoxidase [Gemmatimonadales bacterium]